MPIRIIIDLGICGPMRDDAYAGQPENCGLFKTPTLRNVALRKGFFHNGVYHELRRCGRASTSIARPTGKVYPRRADGSIARYDDLPPRYRANIDRIDAPFGGKPGTRPR